VPSAAMQASSYELTACADDGDGPPPPEQPDASEPAVVRRIANPIGASDRPTRATSLLRNNIETSARANEIIEVPA
jgi:hypothetical protein